MDPQLLITGGFQLLDLFLKIRESLKQSGEWTAEQEAQFSARLLVAYQQPHWIPSTAQPTQPNDK